MLAHFRDKFGPIRGNDAHYFFIFRQPLAFAIAPLAMQHEQKRSRGHVCSARSGRVAVSARFQQRRYRFRCVTASLLCSTSERAGVDLPRSRHQNLTLPALRPEAFKCRRKRGKSSACMSASDHMEVVVRPEV